MPQKLLSRKTSNAGLPGRPLRNKSKGSILKNAGNKEEDGDADSIINEEEKKNTQLPKPTISTTVADGVPNKELDQDITVVLTTDDPNFNKYSTIFSHKTSAYEDIKETDIIFVHLSTPPKITNTNPLAEKDDEDSSELTPRLETHKEEKIIKPIGSRTTGATAKSTEPAKDVDPNALPEKKLPNQFNFIERATQTSVKLYKVKHIQTDPPQKKTFSANISQWDIYDFYEANAKNKENTQGKKESEKLIPADKKVDQKETLSRKAKPAQPPKARWSGLVRSLRIAERMVNQNTYDEITQDFKYWEDVSDEYKGGNGSLLPLWKFFYEEVRDLNVTCIKWSSTYEDLFVASYGSHNFMQQKGGLVCVFSLSNPSHPEYVFPTNSGVTSIDVHKDHSHLIVAGFYDGNVAVFNLQHPVNTSMCQSDALCGKHYEPVWTVQWQSEDMDGNMNFYSVSGDGKITQWILNNNHLQSLDVLTLRLSDDILEDTNMSYMVMTAGATAFSFHPHWAGAFLVGTEEGRIFRCKRKYNLGILMEYECHNNAVYAIHWNYFHDRIFITCSLDCTVKVWDFQISEPIVTYYLASPVGDVKWSPYSATVFAAVTSEGKVFVYDFSTNKYNPICEQIIVPKKNIQLTSITFSRKHPIILVGDNKGFVRSLKLSPNLRKAMSNTENEKFMENEISNLERFMSALKDPNTKPIEL